MPTTNAFFKTRFRLGSGYYSLNQATDSLLAQPFYKSTPSSDKSDSDSYSGKKFQVLFHSPPGVLFTFPSRYWYTIDLWISLADGGPPRFKPDYVSDPTQEHPTEYSDCATGSYPLW